MESALVNHWQEKRITTAVDDMERNEPTNTPSEDLPPHNCNMDYKCSMWKGYKDGMLGKYIQCQQRNIHTVYHNNYGNGRSNKQWMYKDKKSGFQ